MTRPDAAPALEVRWLGPGPVGYREVWALQRRLVEARLQGRISDTLLLLEHQPVVTLGRNAGAGSLLCDAATLAARGIEVVESDRGGDATYHGPGQLVAYPILDLRQDGRDIGRFVRGLEQAMIDTVAAWGVAASRLPGAPGIWLRAPDRKLGAIGARVRRWITSHGLAINVSTDLDAFGLIVPCGLPDKGVTSLSRELGRPVPLRAVGERLGERLAAIFGRVRITGATS